MKPRSFEITAKFHDIYNTPEHQARVLIGEPLTVDEVVQVVPYENYQRVVMESELFQKRYRESTIEIEELKTQVERLKEPSLTERNVADKIARS